MCKSVAFASKNEKSWWTAKLSQVCSLYGISRVRYFGTLRLRAGESIAMGDPSLLRGEASHLAHCEGFLEYGDAGGATDFAQALVEGRERQGATLGEFDVGGVVGR